MAWFYYGDQPVRRYRKGIWLRIASLPEALAQQIKGRMKEGELLAWVVVKELHPANRVLLEVWCYQGVFDKDTMERYTVFHVLADENPKWVCESDVGRGLVKK
jgi:hypothetical protein